MPAYPSHLIPSSRYKKIDDSVLASYRGLVLLRHTPTADIIDEDTGLVKRELVGFTSDHLKDLSTNLIGVFRIEDAFCTIKDEYKDTYYASCIINDKIADGLIPGEGEWYYDESKGWFCINIDRLLNTRWTRNDEEHYTFKVVHTPTKCNFWHVSVRVVDDNGTELDNLGLPKSAKNKIRKAAKAFLITDVIIPGLYNTLPSRFYRHT